VRTNNADLPRGAWRHAAGPLPGTADELDALTEQPFPEIFRAHSVLMAITELSATAPLKLMAKTYGFRAATMPGFSSAMIPALRLDYEEINRRVVVLKDLLDRSDGAELIFQVEDGPECKLILDLQHRTAHASGGLLHDLGTAGNLPSGEAYIVPYEGEIPGTPSLSVGQLPVQFGNEVVIYDIRENIAVRAAGTGAAARREAEYLAREPAYGNIAELGLGVLADFGVKPCGSLLLDEKLGLHIAFGRSDHFGGRVGAAQFTAPEAVVHIDRVYLPSVQPLIKVRLVVLHGLGFELPIIRDDRFVIDFAVE
jgi:leucyl aminopeptidase (aminopeptidase T)